MNPEPTPGRLCVPPLFVQPVLHLSVLAQRSHVAWLTGRVEQRTPREAPMTATALRIDPDGAHLDLELSVDRPGVLLDELKLQVDGELDFGHYARLRPADGLFGIAVAVFEWSRLEMPPNAHATRAVEAARGQSLGNRLHGPVILMGWDGIEDIVPLTAGARAELLAAVQSGGVR